MRVFIFLFFGFILFASEARSSRHQVPPRVNEYSDIEAVSIEGLLKNTDSKKDTATVWHNVQSAVKSDDEINEEDEAIPLSPILGSFGPADARRLASIAHRRIRHASLNGILSKSLPAGATLGDPQTLFVDTPDGAKLHTLIFLPPNNNGTSPTKPRPTVLVRTPYGATLSDTVKLQCLEATLVLGINCAAQDFRGRFESTGKFSFFKHAMGDAAATGEALEKFAWSNGIVFPSGMSADGIAGYLSLKSSEFAKRVGALSVFSGTSDLYTTAFQQGALRWSLFVGWLTVLGEETFIPEILATETNPGSVAPETTLTARELSKNVRRERIPGYLWRTGRVPTIHVAGYFDIFGQPQLETADGFEKAHGTEDATVVIAEPGGHCKGGEFAWPNAEHGTATAAVIRASMIRAATLVGTAAAVPPLPRNIPTRAWYVMGSPGGPGNYWSAGKTFPRSRKRSLYFARGGKLSSRYHTRESKKRRSRSFDFDPANPVPTVGGANLIIPQCGPWDQSAVETRPDVLMYTSSPLRKDLHINGRLRAVLYVSSDRIDTDFTVKLSEVSATNAGANETSLLIADGIVRMRWRNGMSRDGGSKPRVPAWMEPGKTYRVNVDLWTTAWAFAAGNRIRVSVSSSNYPRFSANLNNGHTVAEGGEPLIAHNTVFMGRGTPSRIELPVVAATAQQPYDMSIFGEDIASAFDG